MDHQNVQCCCLDDFEIDQWTEFSMHQEEGHQIHFRRALDTFRLGILHQIFFRNKSRKHLMESDT